METTSSSFLHSDQAVAVANRGSGTTNAPDIHVISSQDLLQQALQEVSQPSNVQQVKEEPEMFDRMEQLLATSSTPSVAASPLDIETLSRVGDRSAIPTPNNIGEIDKVKIESPPINVLQGPSTAGSVDLLKMTSQPMILIPTLQSDGTVAYTFQQGGGSGFNQTVPSILNQASIINPNISSPTKTQQKIAILRPTPKQKVILPKTLKQGQSPIIPPSPVVVGQPTTKGLSPVSRMSQSSIRTTPVLQQTPSQLSCSSRMSTMTPVKNNIIPLNTANKISSVPAILRRSDPSTNVRKVQLITGEDGQRRNIEIITCNGETSISSDQPLTQLEIQHVQSIIQHQREDGSGGGKQVYKVVYPAHIKQNSATVPPPGPSKTKTIDLVNLEEEISLEENNDDQEHSFSVAAIVREFTKRGRSKRGSRGRPRKGSAKIINEKKVITELRRELGLREVKVKEFGLMEHMEDEAKAEGEESEFTSSNSSRTRSGRISRPPPRIRKTVTNHLDDNFDESSQDISDDVLTVSTGAITDMNIEPPPKVEDNIPLPNRRNFIPPAKYICKVCGKLYLGEKKIAKHLKHFPSHEFATPEPPPSPSVKENKKLPCFDSFIAECDPNKFMDQVGAKIFKSFSLWDLLVKKTISKRLGTVESLMSLLADMQAIVIELKNLVEQCLSCERTNEDSFCVTLTPIMSSVLGLSQSGGVTRYVLPYTQIPEHYHKLLSFPTGIRTANLVSSSTDPNLMSPESTNSLIHPEEENSQMSLSSDILDQPLCDKVVLEDNLGARPLIHDLDEETQDSSITAPSPVPPLKRTRLDSESHSVISPPPQTPDFLSQGDDSNLSTISTTVTEPSQTVDIPAKRIKTSLEPETGGTKIADESLHTKLPSFSSIINGSPKQDVEGSSEEERSESVQPESQLITNDVASISGSLSDSNPNTSLFNTSESSVVANFETNFPESSTSTPPATTSTGSHDVRLQSSRITCISQESFAMSSSKTETIGGSAPVSPRVSYGTSHNPGFNRRCSLDNIHRSGSEVMMLGIASKLQDSSSSILDIPLQNIHGTTENQVYKSSTLPNITVDRYSIESSVSSGSLKVGSSSIADESVVTTFEFQPSMTRTESVFVTSESQANNSQAWGTTYSQSSNAKKSVINQDEKGSQLNPLLLQYPKTSFTSEQSDQREPFSQCTVTSSEYETAVPSSKTSILKALPKPQPPQNYPQGTSTHVTFSEELSHPIPSVSPAKDFRDIDLKRQNPTPPSESQSSSIFSDLESVLNEATDFSFHSELAGPDRCQVKTPEKMLASVPPAEIMNKKSAITFDNILEFDKGNEAKSLSTICHSPLVTSNDDSGAIPILAQNILDTSSSFQFPSSSSSNENC